MTYIHVKLGAPLILLDLEDEDEFLKLSMDGYSQNRMFLTEHPVQTDDLGVP